MADLFQDLFGSGLFGGSRGGGQRQGKNLRAKVEITLEEAYQGTEKTLRIKRYKKCPDCNGTGSEEGSLKTCFRCQGRGRIRQTRQTPFGRQAVVSPRPECEGRGKVPEQPCSRCDGSGRIQQQEKIEIKVPQGARTGQRLGVQNKGNYGGRNSGTGDLFVIIEVQEHDYLERREENLFYNLELSMPQAALGSGIKVPTLDGQVKIKIPAGTQTGDIFRLNGKEIPRVRGRGKGDLFIKAVVQTPESLSKVEKELMKQLRQIEGDKSEAEKGFFEAVKDNIKDAF